MLVFDDNYPHFSTKTNIVGADLYLSPAESLNFWEQENPLIFMLSKHFWQFTSLTLNTLI